MITITLDTAIVISITAFIMGVFNATGQYFVTKYLLEHLPKIKKREKK
jgi:hypothetical protein